MFKNIQLINLIELGKRNQSASKLAILGCMKTEW